MTFQTIYPREIENLQKEERALLVDIREREAFRKEHWNGAVCAPYDSRALWYQGLPKHRPIILYCEHGGSSMLAGRTLGQQGYKVYAVVGGYEAMKKLRK